MDALSRLETLNVEMDALAKQAVINYSEHPRFAKISESLGQNGLK